MKTRSIILGIVFFGISLLFFIAIFSFWNVRPVDWTNGFSQRNIIGPVGAYIATSLIFLFGIGSLFIPAFLLLVGLDIVMEKPKSPILRLFVGIIFLFLLSILASPLSNPSLEFKITGGGWVGFKLGMFLLFLLNKVGSYIVVISLFLISLVYLTDGRLFSFIGSLFSKREKKKKPAPKVVVRGVEEKEEKEPKEKKLPQLPEVKPSPQRLEGYEFPPLSLLSDPHHISEKEQKEDLLSLSKQLEETLFQFKIETKVVCINRGPVVTSFEIQPAPGVRISSISSLADDIALALAAIAVRIEAPIPGKQAIGVEIPNRKPDRVFLKEGLTSSAFSKETGNLLFYLGKDVRGEDILVDLTEMPHLLIAGVTGSGKSVCLASIITSLIYRSTPNDVKLMLIDPKRVEMTVFSGIPHLLTPVIVESKKAVIALQWLIREMEDRYKSFSEAGVRDITGFRKKEQLPYIVVVIDELSDLMVISSQACEETLIRLSQMARAVGIHLVIATQRPSVDVITGIIKANFPSRIAFQVFSKIDSRTILDMMGAEKLLGKGDMLYFPASAPKPIRAQGAYVSLSEIEKVCGFIKACETEVLGEKLEFEQIKERVEEKEEELNDEMYEKALSIVGLTGYASTSMIQRKLKIGYNRAASLLEKMEEEGIVGPPDGSKPREILVDIKEMRR
ncbi:MAG: DNA translocase FtsK [bacterium]|nr:DNA translocase FtsK [bacterium]